MLLLFSIFFDLDLRYIFAVIIVEIMHVHGGINYIYVVKKSQKHTTEIHRLNDT